MDEGISDSIFAVLRDILFDGHSCLSHLFIYKAVRKAAYTEHCLGPEL